MTGVGFLILFVCVCLYVVTAVNVSPSYTSFLYEKYVEEIKSASAKIPSSAKTIQNNEVSCKYSASYGEMIYMHMRESVALSALNIYGNGDINVLFWMIQALQKNARFSRSNVTLGVMYSFDRTTELSKTLNNFVVDYSLTGVKVQFMDISAHAAHTVSKEKLSAVSYDAVFFDELSHHLFPVHQVLGALTQHRSLTAAGLLVFFHTPRVGLVKRHFSKENVNSIAKRKRELLRSHSGQAAEDGSALDSITSAAAEHDELIHWLGEQSHKMSIDVTYFGEKRSVDIIQAQRSKSKLTPASVNEQCSIALATVVPQPRVSIVIPAGRVHLLPNLLRSIKFNLVSEVIVVHSHRSGIATPQLGHLRNPKIVELFNTKTPGKFGNPERNMGLASLPRSRVGWVYFLDDDNMMHQNMWMVMQTQAVRNVVLLGGENCPNYKGTSIHVPVGCKAGNVDSVYSLFSTQLVLRKPWAEQAMVDEPYVMSACLAAPSNTVVLPLVATYQNGQLCVDVMENL
jgi:hypothetical protein